MILRIAGLAVRGWRVPLGRGIALESRKALRTGISLTSTRRWVVGDDDTVRLGSLERILIFLGVQSPTLADIRSRH